ncbi:MAG: sulfite exporter TauE/SafE family protein [Chlamydiota bacterium]|nr:sulfite exporter TauE/SafE family protein [Chlamydiota bacterium]
MTAILFCVIGLLAGMMGGLMGIGGGLIMVPALVYVLKFNQHLAQGTSLAAMIPPIGLLAAYRYYMDGNVNIPAALWICTGFFVGGFFGAQIAHFFSDAAMKKLFGFFLLLVSLRMMIGK